MKFTFGQVLEIKGNCGVCVDRGFVKVIAVMDAKLVDDHQVYPYTDDLEESQKAEILSDPWYAVEYVDETIGCDWGTLYFPEFSLIDVAVK